MTSCVGNRYPLNLMKIMLFAFSSFFSKAKKTSPMNLTCNTQVTFAKQRCTFIWFNNGAMVLNTLINANLQKIADNKMFVENLYSLSTIALSVDRRRPHRYAITLMVYLRKQERCSDQNSSTSMQYMRSKGRSRIKIQGVEMGRIRVGFRDQGAELGRFK